MAKKPIISDFSALKGKVSFSEQEPDVHKPKDTVKEAPKENKEPGLKVGMSVVLMDSNL